MAIQSDPVTASTFVTAETLSEPAVASGTPQLFRCILVAQTMIKLIAIAAGPPRPSTRSSPSLYFVPVI